MDTMTHQDIVEGRNSLHLLEFNPVLLVIYPGCHSLSDLDTCSGFSDKNERFLREFQCIDTNILFNKLMLLISARAFPAFAKSAEYVARMGERCIRNFVGETWSKGTTWKT
jgi:hypothetical protein